MNNTSTKAQKSTRRKLLVGHLRTVSLVFSVVFIIVGLLAWRTLLQLPENHISLVNRMQLSYTLAICCMIIAFLCEKVYTRIPWTLTAEQRQLLEALTHVSGNAAELEMAYRDWNWSYLKFQSELASLHIRHLARRRGRGTYLITRKAEIALRKGTYHWSIFGPSDE